MQRDQRALSIRRSCAAGLVTRHRCPGLLAGSRLFPDPPARPIWIAERRASLRSLIRIRNEVGRASSPHRRTLAAPDTAQGRDTPAARAALAGWKIIIIERARGWRDLTSLAGHHTPGARDSLWTEDTIAAHLSSAIATREQAIIAAACVVDYRSLTSLAGRRTPDDCARRAAGLLLLYLQIGRMKFLDREYFLLARFESDPHSGISQWERSGLGRAGRPGSGHLSG